MRLQPGGENRAWRSGAAMSFSQLDGMHFRVALKSAVAAARRCSGAFGSVAFVIARHTSRTYGGVPSSLYCTTVCQSPMISPSYAARSSSESGRLHGRSAAGSAACASRHASLGSLAFGSSSRTAAATASAPSRTAL